MLSSFSSLDRHMLVHSGERPFSCQVCGQTFTTNGNMHRHRRTHNVRDSCESDGSGGSGAAVGTPGGKRSRKRKAAAGPAASSPGAEKLQHQLKMTAAATTAAASPMHSRLMTEGKYSVSPLPRCPLGCPDTFYSELSLELHLLSLHPGKEIRCEECGHPCPTYNYFKLHRNMFHFGRFGSGTPVVPTGFPLPPPPSVSCASLTAGQSALFSTGPLQPLLIASQTDLSSGRLAATTPGIIAALSRPSSPVKKEDEQQQLTPSDLLNASFCSDNGVDDDPELREMKLKGEFPCRRCPAVFPNLRALKGHNKEHLTSPPFECNVGTCSYSTPDKSILLQHMRGHTGQKPFECRLCNFGFTTKANCERHVKNKHNKNSKDDVRDHIIIHEGADGDDNDAASGRGGSSESSLSLLRPARLNSSTFFELTDATTETVIFPPTPPRSSAFIPYRPFEVDRDIVDSEEEMMNDDDVVVGDDAPLDLSQAAATRRPLVPGYPSSADLEIDAKENTKLARLDESKKPLMMDPLMMGLLPFGHHPYPGGSPIPASFPFGFPLLTGGPSPAPFWPPHLLGSGGGAAAPFPFNPMHLAALLAVKNDEIKKADAAAAAQITQETATHTALQALNQLQQQAAQHHGLMSQISPASSSSLSTHSPQSSPMKPAGGPAPAPHSSESESSSSYKMIIKNGVLMRKQKQRRYRTERPYGCEACKARFTLRSNMDRHMKQQHPDVYYQKPRTGPGRKPAAAPASGGQSSEEQLTQQQVQLTSQETVSRQQEQHQQPLEERVGSKAAFESDEEEEEEEEGFVEEEEEEEAEQDLVIDDGDKMAANTTSYHQQNFKNISQFFAAQNCVRSSREDLNTEEAASESSSSSAATGDEKKQLSAYSAAPHRMSCPYCGRKFPWASSLERHILTHTGQKPYRCTDCPLWFTTKSNCDRHIVRKHGGIIVNNNNNEDENEKMGDDWEDRGSEEEEEEEGFLQLPGFVESAAAALPAGRRDSTGSESPYKCHLCDDGFVERAAAIQHLESSHAEEYSLLVTRGAFNVSAQEEPTGAVANAAESSEELYDQLRGKFPDYVNRKVVCLFCARKFWSAEDLRRHVRTHTGERPYSCDICARRFTLKHSMLRHKKKHDSGVSSNGEEDGRSDDEDCAGGSHRSSSGGRSSPEVASVVAVVAGRHLAESYDRKRANLMEKISRLNTATESSL